MKTIKQSKTEEKKPSSNLDLNYEQSFGKVAKVLLFSIFLSIILVSCSQSFSGKKYVTEDSELYIEFMNENTIEWKWDKQFGAEELEYTIEDKKIRAIRKLMGNGQVRYIDILDDNKLKGPNGKTYILQ
tara:strand:+ start:99 stop:485 length:387 start_codon:yes stop_codon:yes gene_type:complete